MRSSALFLWNFCSAFFKASRMYDIPNHPTGVPHHAPALSLMEPPMCPSFVPTLPSFGVGGGGAITTHDVSAKIYMSYVRYLLSAVWDCVSPERRSPPSTSRGWRPSLPCATSNFFHLGQYRSSVGGVFTSSITLAVQENSRYDLTHKDRENEYRSCQYCIENASRDIPPSLG
jgi:hypothetical protein